MADTAALVVALSAQLTKFEKDMQKAGIMAEKATNDIENKFSKMNPQINASFLGNLFANMASKGIDAAVQGITDLINRFQDLQKTAEYAGVSLQWLYGVQEAGAKAGASVSNINDAVKSLAFSLDEMKRGGDNALKTLLDANPKFMKGVNRDTMDVAKTLEVVSNIIAGLPNKIQQVDVATKLGMPASAVALLEKGGAAVAEMAAKAERAGPALEKMAAQSKAITQWWALFIDNLSSGVITAFFEGLKTRLEQLVALFEKLQFGQEGTALGNFIDKSLPSLRSAVAEMEKVNKPQKVEVKGGTTGGGAVDPFANKKTVANQRDEFERANDQITKHIALMEADAAAVGKGVAEQERLRTTTILMEAERRRLNLAEGAAITISDELAAKIAKQAAAAGAAAQKLAEANYKMQQMNAASQQFGSALSNAFTDAILEGKKLNNVLSEMIKTLARAAIQWAIMAPFTPGAGGGVAPISKLLGFAGGTNFAPGGMALVGERGPELVNLPRGSQVIPNDVLRQGGMGGGGAITYAPAIDARGASVEAVARLAQIMEQDRAAFASRTVAVIQQARRGRVPGL